MPDNKIMLNYCLPYFHVLNSTLFLHSTLVHSFYIDVVLTLNDKKSDLLNSSYLDISWNWKCSLKVYKMAWLWFVSKLYLNQCWIIFHAPLRDWPSNLRRSWPCFRHLAVAAVLHLRYLLNSSPLDKMAAISPTIFSDSVSWMKTLVFWLNITEVCS